MRQAKKNYWEIQQQLTLLHVEKTELEIEESMRKALLRAHKEIKAELDAFYKKYQDQNGGISRKQAEARLSPKEMRMFRARAKRYLDYMDKNKNLLHDPETRRHAERFSRTAYVSRLEEMMFNIETKVNNMSARQGSEMKKGLKQAFEDGFFRTSFNAAKQIGLRPSFTSPSNKQLEAAATQHWMGRTFSDSLWKNKNALMETLREVIPQEFARGKGSSDVARRIQEALGGNLSDCKRLARTEMNYTANQGTLLAYKEAGVDRYEYVATLDNRTSLQCIDMDGKVFSLDAIEVGVNYPPLHPYCRSTTIPYYEDDDIAPLVTDRVARGENGKTVRLGKNVTYEQWIKEFAPAHVVARFAALAIIRPSYAEGIAEDVAVVKVFDYGDYESFTLAEARDYLGDYLGDRQITHSEMPDVYRNYVRTTNSYDMNQFMRSGQYAKALAAGPPKGLAKQIHDFRKYVNDAPGLPKNTRLVRAVTEEGLHGLLKEALGGNSWEARKLTGALMDQWRANRVGKGKASEREAVIQDFRSKVTATTLQTAAFTSTSYDIKKNVFTDRKCLLQIYADKGTDALVTCNHGESEIIFNAGVKMRILDADLTNNDHVIIKVRIVNE